MPVDVRKAVVSALLQVSREGGYSNIVLDNLLNTAALSPADRMFASRLFYGVIERQITLDYIIGQTSSLPMKKMHPVIVEILRTGLYQIYYMDKIPSSAAVNEAVNMAKSMKQGHAAGFVNGVLRSAVRQRDAVLQAIEEGKAGDSIRFSCPQSLVDFWENAYGSQLGREILEHINDVPDTIVRVNTLHISEEDFATLLENAGVIYEKLPNIPACFRVKCGSDLKRLAKIDKNCYYHQDTASQLCCLALSPQPGEHIADICAAPGGKSFTIAQYMQNEGYLLAGDVYAHKCEEMSRRAKEYGITVMRTVVRDGQTPVQEDMKGTFDRVLCDVPCSGLGVIRRKPEIRYKSLESLKTLPELQYTILHQSSSLVKIGGVLQYSTCTLNPAENEEVAARFLHAHTDFAPRILPLDACFAQSGLKPAAYITLFPHIHNTDGFFVAGFTRTR